MSIKNKLNLFNQKIFFGIFILSLLTITFLASYFLTDYLVNPSYRVKDNKTNKTVYNSNANYLNDDILITLITGEKIDHSTSLKNIKNIFNLENDLELSSLSVFFSKEDYLLSKWDYSSLTYIRDENENSSKLLANKYYLGEENGFITLFLTNENGEIILEEKNVYTDYKPINNLPQSDQELIINNKFYYDTREDALIKLSEMVS